ncbi:MAG TPA: transglycosylase SLT domain-containing protein [Candidatus Limnocylindrales bacterium]|nr:transglycosylase SLT domain-containing protein [Candidatus Limnocylindrales bacterium]
MTVCPTVLWADIYRFVDAEGVVHFTNAKYDQRYKLYLREGAREIPAAKGSAATRWMMEYADRYSRAHNLSPALVKAIIRAESNGNRFAISRKGAKGMMQLMPFTSKRLKVNDPFDPVENIEGGVKYIKELLDVFQGNVAHAVAAYNAGPAAVQKYGGIPPYQETRVYVKRVMDDYQKNASKE